MSTGEAILALARTRVGEAYRLGISVDLDDPNYHGRLHGTEVPKLITDDKAWDCAELYSWAHAIELKGERIGCGRNGDEPYTGFLAQESAEELNGLKRISLETAFRTPGAGLLRAPGEGVGGHVALSDGNGGAIEAHSTAKGVVHTANVTRNRWTCGLAVRSVLYTTSAPPPQAPRVVLPTIFSVGSRGALVRAVQTQLGVRGYPVKVDGDYGGITAAAVRRFQIANGLLPDGEVGPFTHAALFGVSP